MLDYSNGNNQIDPAQLNQNRIVAQINRIMSRRESVSYPLWKRIEDIAGAILTTMVVGPILPFVALAVKLEYPKEPILVKLPRVSEGRIIYVYKFRGMIPGADKMKPGLMHLNERTDGPFFKIRHDPRVTRVGRVIRKFRLDELPQLINVLKGELSLVGPRPHELMEVEQYPEEHKHIPLSRAGLTGISQVNGASSLPFLKELELDGRYIKELSPWTDIKIIVKSAAILFFDPTAV